MAVVTGTVYSVQTLRADYVQRVQLAEVLFTVTSSQTYAQADNGSLAGVATLIQNSRRNGKTVTMVGVAPAQAASKSSDPASYMSLKTVAISTNDVTFEITDGSDTTELANGAVPAQSRPFGLLVAFTEA
jgi:hypothetical protein